MRITVTAAKACTGTAEKVEIENTCAHCIVCTECTEDYSTTILSITINGNSVCNCDGETKQPL